MRPSALSEIMRNKRRVSKQMAEKLLVRFGASDDEWKSVVETFRARNSETYHFLDMDTYRVVADWYHFALLSLMRTEGFQPNAEWISKRLGIPKRTAETALATLVRVGIIKFQDKKLIRTKKALHSPDGVSNPVLVRAHLQNLERVRASLLEDDIEVRDLTAITMAINPGKLPEAKERIRRFRDELARFLETEPREEVYKLCIQLVPITKGENA